jgi:general secretion pathway protein E/type IV pilus assembly protein PilB
MALRIGDILIEKKMITPVELEKALQEQRRTKQSLGVLLVNMGYITEEALLKTLAEQQGMLFVELRNITIDERALKIVPAKLAIHYKIMPITLLEGALTIAISDPFDMWPVDDLETHLGCRIERVLATHKDISEALKKYYGVGADTVEQLLGAAAEEKPSDAVATSKDELEKMAEDVSVVKLVNQILQQAIHERASDIHIEKYREQLSLRFRVDGILHDIKAPEEIKRLCSAIISRIKIMSGLNIIERRLPQDGRALFRVQDREYDLRISVLPTLCGENVVIRILPTTMLLNLSDLGLMEDQKRIFETLLQRKYGIIFLTGPTGSGKTTTLYAFLSQLNQRESKIVTIEDPIEYELEGLTQIQTKPMIGLTFASILRSVLRHDPDIIMVGEVRDKETAEITIQTSMTGHLVFSTLHTNDAATGVTRLMDIGIEPFLISSTVNAFIAQRLVRVICPHCKKEIQGDPETIRMIASEIGKNPSEIRLFRGEGCQSCSSTGYLGRTGIYEILMLRQGIRELITKRSSADTLKKAAVDSGMRTLRQDGWLRAIQGITTAEEVLRVVHLEDF